MTQCPHIGTKLSLHINGVDRDGQLFQRNGIGGVVSFSGISAFLVCSAVILLRFFSPLSLERSSGVGVYTTTVGLDVLVNI